MEYCGDRMYAFYSTKQYSGSNAEYCYFLAWCDEVGWISPVNLGCYRNLQIGASTDGVLSTGANESTDEVWVLLPDDIKVVKDREVRSIKRTADLILGAAAICWWSEKTRDWSYVYSGFANSPMLLDPQRIVEMPDGMFLLLGTGVMYSENDGKNWYWLD